MEPQGTIQLEVPLLARLLAPGTLLFQRIVEPGLAMRYRAGISQDGR